MDKINFKKGTLSFEVPRGMIDYKDNKFIDLVNYVDENGSLRIVKDKDNGMKVYYKYNNTGYAVINEPAPEVDKEEECKIMVTWSMDDLELKLYIDGQIRKSQPIEVDPKKL